MSIEVISAWGNEPYLAPFFFKHYSYAQKITILFDKFWKNEIDNIFKDAPKNVYIVPIEYGDNGTDEMKKSRTIAEVYRKSTCNYCVCPDADEFIFGTPEEIESGFDFCKVRLFDVYRHVTDSDITIDKPVKEQRRHGYFKWMYNKPIVLRCGNNVDFDSGQHMIFVDGIRHNYVLRGLSKEQRSRYKPGGLIGAHWCFADLSFCLKRRYGKRLRHGKRFDYEYNKITEQSIIEECKKHENDAQVF